MSAAFLAVLFGAFKTAVAAAVGVAAYIATNKAKLTELRTDAVAVARDFDHAPKLDEMGKDLADVKKLVEDILPIVEATHLNVTAEPGPVLIRPVGVAPKAQ